MCNQKFNSLMSNCNKTDAIGILLHVGNNIQYLSILSNWHFAQRIVVFCLCPPCRKISACLHFVLLEQYLQMPWLNKIRNKINRLSYKNLNLEQDLLQLRMMSISIFAIQYLLKYGSFHNSSRISLANISTKLRKRSYTKN